MPLKPPPELPASLSIFECRDCQNLKEITHFNNNLLRFRSSGCENLERLPQETPSKLVEFSLSGAYVKSLPKLNEGLAKLDCGNNEKLTALPNPLPSTLVHLEFRNTPVTEVPQPLPQKLTTFIGRESELKTLPQMPKGIKEIDISWCEHLQVPENYRSTLPADVKYSH